MGNDVQKSSQPLRPAGTGRKPAIWLALAVALGLHLLILLLPLSRPAQDARPVSEQIELQLTRYEPAQVNEEIFIPDNTTALEPATREPPGPTVPEPKSLPLVKALSETPPATSLTPIERDIEKMNAPEKARLTRSILSSQFITEESAADQLFGKPLEPDRASTHKDFHFPLKPNLIAMLDQPMQELPFEYTPGLVYFAYAPGLKGDLQRFGDMITPEFSFITRYGTRVKCIWVLVIGGCAWGRP